MFKSFLAGLILALAIVAYLVFLAVDKGLIPANADGKPSNLERWIARTSLRATLDRVTPSASNPVPWSDANIEAGIKLYAANCTVCHGAANHSRSNIAAGLFAKPLQLAQDGVENHSAGVTFWEIKHGIRYTGMPAFGAALSDQQIWQLALFLKYMNNLPPRARRAWDRVRNPAALAPASPASP